MPEWVVALSPILLGFCLGVATRLLLVRFQHTRECPRCGKVFRGFVLWRVQRRTYEHEAQNHQTFIEKPYRGDEIGKGFVNILRHNEPEG